MIIKRANNVQKKFWTTIWKLWNKDKLPNDDDFTFTNGYYSWVSAIFVDMRDSTELCADEDKEKLAKGFPKLFLGNY